jgi:signal peptidase
LKPKHFLIAVVIAIILYSSTVTYFGTPSPFLFVTSGSMMPAMKVNDMAVISGHIKFSEIQVGDIIAFNPVKYEKKVIHRVVEIKFFDGIKEVRTMGDTSIESIGGIDYPISEKNYIGKVINIIPHIGIVLEIFKFPLNFMFLGILVSIMILYTIKYRKTMTA